MDLFDKINEVMDDLNIGVEKSVGSIDDALKAAKFIMTISDPEERENAIVQALKQAYQMGIESK